MKQGHQQAPPPVDAADLVTKAYGDATYATGGAADALSTTGADVDVAAAVPPTTGQVLKAVDATHATWQAEAGGGAAAALSTTGADVDVAAAAPPTTGQVLKATDATHATWQADTATDADAIHKGTSAEISTVTEKTNPVAGDLLLIEDSQATNTKKRIQVGNVAAAKLATSGASVGIAAASPPTTGQILKAASPTAASWVDAPEPAGTAVVQHAFAELSADQVVGAPAVLDFDTLIASNGITVDANGRFTLTEGKTYRLISVLECVGTSTDSMAYKWYDVTATTFIGKQGSSRLAGSSTTNSGQQCAIAIITAAAGQQVELQFQAGSGTPTARKVSSYAHIEELIASSVGQTAQKYVNTIRAGDIASHDSATPMVVSQFAFNPSEYSLAGVTRSLVFRAVAANGGGVAETKARLYSVTDTEYIGTGLTFTASSPTKQEETLTIGAGAGEVDDSEKIYEVHIWVVSPDTVDDTIELGSAELRLVNTID